MILNLRELESFPAHVFLEGDPERITPVFDSICGVTRATLTLDIQISGEEYFCQGDLTATVRLECARCLREFDAQVGNKTDFIVCSDSLYTDRARKAVDNEDYVFFRGADLQVDLSDIVRQTIILAVGMKPLCMEECRGLCPICGINRNEQNCSCAVRRTDPRWEGLRKLRNDSQRNEV
ncbi:MAG TPA: DUF177 domain-containing protein [Candidatus Deferrimicrobium sp.]|nr:DUF177 domain-containing protein [Candidatus Deferrimicrobium sp.]